MGAFKTGKQGSNGFKSKNSSSGFKNLSWGNSNLNSRSSGRFGRGNRFGSGFHSRVR